MASWIDRYQFEFESRREGVLRVKIQKDEVSGSVKTILPSGLKHTATNWRSSGKTGFEPFLFSSTTISFADRVPIANGTDFELAEFVMGLSHDREARIRIETEGGSLIWIGYIVPQDISQSEDYLSIGSIKANDGLALLKDIDYVDSGGDFYTGRDTVANIIIELLNKVGHATWVNFECDWYAGGLGQGIGETTLPLSQYYIDQEVFRHLERSISAEEWNNKTWDELIDERWLDWDKMMQDPNGGFRLFPGLRRTFDANGDLLTVEETPVTAYSVLEHLLRRFNLQCSMGDNGTWEVFQPEQKNKSSVRQWYYDTAKSLQSTNTYNPRVTIVSDLDERGPGTLGGERAATSCEVGYNHGRVQFFRDPNLSLIESDAYGLFFQEWARTGGDIDLINLASDSNAYAARLALGGPNIRAKSDYPLNNGADSWPDPYDNFGQTSGIWVDVSEIAQLVLTMQYGWDVGWAGIPHIIPFLPIRVQWFTSGTHYYLSENEVYDQKHAQVGPWAWFSALGSQADEYFYLFLNPSDAGDTNDIWIDVPTPPEDGYMVISIWQPGLWNSLLDQTTPIGGFGAANMFVDHIKCRPILSTDAYNAESTTVINYVDRANRNPIKLPVSRFGDGPTTGHRGAITFDSAGLNITSDWKIGFYDTGQGDSGDSINVLQSRVLLEQFRNPRRTHQAEYGFESPVYRTRFVLYRNGQAYYPTSLTKNWKKTTMSGTWYRINQDSFSDDVDYLSSSSSSQAFAGSTSGQQFLLQQGLVNLSLGQGSRILASTDAAVNAGSHTSLPIATMTEALIDSGDQIVLVSPALDFYNLTVNRDQLVNDGSLFIEEYLFPFDIGYPASIYKVEEEVLTAVRIGERGFAVTAEGGPDLILANNGSNGSGLWNAGSGPYTTLFVRPSEIELPAGAELSIKHQNGDTGTRVITTSRLKRRQTTVPIVSQSFDAEAGDWLYVPGRVSSSEIIQTKNQISLAIWGDDSDTEVYSGPFAYLDDDYNGNFSSVDIRGPLAVTGLPVKLYAGSVVRIGGREIVVSDASTQVDFDPGEADEGGTMTRSAGSWISDGWERGMFVKVEGTASNNRAFKITNVTALVIYFSVRDDATTEAAVTPTLYGFWEDQWLNAHAQLALDYNAGSTPSTLAIHNPGSASQSVSLHHIREFSAIEIVSVPPQTARTSLSLSLEGIDVVANRFASQNWLDTGGVVNGSGYITAFGSHGWCISGGGDFHASGTIYAGGWDNTASHAPTEIGGSGIEIVASGAYAVERAISIVSQGNTASALFEVYAIDGGLPGSEFSVQNGALTTDGQFIIASTAAYSTFISANLGQWSFGGDVSVVNLGLRGYVRLTQIAAPGDPAAANWDGTLYMLNSSSGLWFKPNGGSAVDLTSGGNVGSHIVVDDTLYVDGSGIGAGTALYLTSEDTLSVRQNVYAVRSVIIDSASATYEAEADVEILGTKVVTYAKTYVEFFQNLILNDSWMRFDQITAPGAPGVAGQGYLYMQTGQLGLFWHPNSGSEVDLTEKFSFAGVTIDNCGSGKDVTLTRLDRDITITSIDFSVRGTTPSIDFTIRHDPDRSAAGTEVVTGGNTASSQSGDTEDTFDAPQPTAGDWLWVETTAASGTVEEFHVTVHFLYQ